MGPWTAVYTSGLASPSKKKKSLPPPSSRARISRRITAGGRSGCSSRKRAAAITGRLRERHRCVRARAWFLGHAWQWSCTLVPFAAGRRLDIICCEYAQENERESEREREWERETSAWRRGWAVRAGVRLIALRWGVARFRTLTEPGCVRIGQKPRVYYVDFAFSDWFFSYGSGTCNFVR